MYYMWPSIQSSPVGPPHHEFRQFQRPIRSPNPSRLTSRIVVAGQFGQSIVPPPGPLKTASLAASSLPPSFPTPSAFASDLSATDLFNTTAAVPASFGVTSGSQAWSQQADPATQGWRTFPARLQQRSLSQVEITSGETYGHKSRSRSQCQRRFPRRKRKATPVSDLSDDHLLPLSTVIIVSAQARQIEPTPAIHCALETSRDPQSTPDAQKIATEQSTAADLLDVSH
ncbi:hypothetical protein F5Y18DRAFT_428097 [Xylariaceae sp. FL1019]|nr:hypothetical protein F5Y18DRAFT_428097 [Xylariaceae sp. FL1019]